MLFSSDVTAVGGTEPSSSAETTAGLSSGGFSNRYAQPGAFESPYDSCCKTDDLCGAGAAWQADAVKNYFKAAGQPFPASTQYNASGRGFPDVSAQAVNFVVVNNGFEEPGVSGTSAACPTFSAVVAAAN